MKTIFKIIFLSFLLLSACSHNKCKTKTCCPKEGHGPCPICIPFTK